MLRVIFLGQFHIDPAVDAIKAVGGHVLQQSLVGAALALVVALHLPEGGGNLGDRLQGALLRNALRHAQLHGEEFARHFGREDGAHKSARHQSAAQHQQSP